MVLYHGSPDKGIKVFTPRVSTHGKAYIYAAKRMDDAILYCAKWNDFMITCCSDEVIVERYEGAIDELYKDRKGFIYVIDGSTFHRIDNNENDDLVSEVPVNVIDCLTVNNLYEIVINKFNIFRYPDKPSFIPKDDNDIVHHAILIYNMCGDLGIFRYIENKFPHLIQLLNDEINRNNITL
jgi:hypothetical protein